MQEAYENRRRCNVKLKIMNEQLPGYRAEEIQFIDGFPVVSFLPFMVYGRLNKLEKHRQRCEREGRTHEISILESLPNGSQHVMENWSNKPIIPIHDDNFKKMAIEIVDSLENFPGTHRCQEFVDLCKIALNQLDPSVTSIQNVSISPAPQDRPRFLEGKEANVLDLGNQQSRDSGNPKRNSNQEACASKKVCTIQAENPHLDAVIMVAQKVVGILSGLGFRCAVFGGDLLFDRQFSPIVSHFTFISEMAFDLVKIYRALTWSFSLPTMLNPE